MNHTTLHTDIEDIYDAVQTGEIESVKMGDTINGKFLVVDNIGNFTELEADTSYFVFTELVKNHSTGESFTEQYVAKDPCPLSPSAKHLEMITHTCELIK